MTTLKLTSVTDMTVNFSDRTSVNQDHDVDSAGNTIGFDNTYVTATGTDTATADAALAINGGFPCASSDTKRLYSRSHSSHRQPRARANTVPCGGSADGRLLHAVIRPR